MAGNVIFATYFPLAAIQLQELLVALVALAPAVLFILRTVFSQMTAQPPQGRPGQRPRGERAGPAHRPAAPPVAAGKGEQPDPADEVAEFLRRAAELRKAGERPAQPQKARPPAPSRAQQRPPAAPERGVRTLVDKPAAPASPRSKTEAGAPASQRERPGQRELAELRTHPTNVDLSEQALEAHVESVFTHSVGKLTSEPRSQAPTAELAASGEKPVAEALGTTAGIVDLLQSGDRLRQAVILSEILQPRGERW